MYTFYPEVADEEATLKEVLAGRSIARYGDGELKIMEGRRCVSQTFDENLAQELRTICFNANSAALVGIPTLNKLSPKFDLWDKMRRRWKPFTNPKKQYYSSFITRPDSAPWLGTKEYFDKIESLWRDQPVTFVGNGVRSLTPKFLMDTGARGVVFVECSYAHSYWQIDDLESRAWRAGNHRVLLCVGPTATCLAERLAKRGLHAVDLGHIGMFWRRYGQFWKWREQREINKDTGVVEPNP